MQILNIESSLAGITISIHTIPNDTSYILPLPKKIGNQCTVQKKQLIIL